LAWPRLVLETRRVPPEAMPFVTRVAIEPFDQFI
jgi:hypothetical protein